MSHDLLTPKLKQELGSATVEIHDRWRRGITEWVMIGDRLIAMKDQMPHGAWADWVNESLPFSVRTARKLMQISRDDNVRRALGMAKRPHEAVLGEDQAVLPADYTTLAECCGLESDQFDRLIADGVIHPDMRRGDVKTAVAALTRPDTTDTLAAQATQLSGAENGYRAILADPPWRFETRGRGGDRMADHHYPTMSFEDICALPVAELAADDCALFLWITTENLMRGQEVMSSWGFDYKTVAFVWRKTSGPMGLGYWTRKQTELCLMGARGRPARQARDVEDIIEAPRGRHSKKPDEQYSRIERLVGGPCIELFARTPRAGWDNWGNEVAQARDGDDE